jgi:hypothetical protein
MNGGRLHGSVWVAVTFALGGCAEPALSPTAERDGLPDSAQIFAEVTRLRKLPSKRAPRVQFLRRHEYRAMLESDEGAEQRGLEVHAEQLGLSAGRATLSDERARLLGSGGLYRQRDQTIYVLDDPNRRFPALLEQVVAHESVHALQDQNGLLPAPDQKFSLDESLARRALIEGDATLGMLLYEERHWHTPPARLAERVRRGFAEEPISRYVGATSPELAGSPAYQQELTIFPYRAGAAFLGALLSTGGYELVAQAFASPPRSTAQIMHPERYAKGEQPVAVPPPPPPNGYQLVSHSVLGELMTRSLLLRCNPRDRAIQAADGWRGDALATLSAGDNQIVAQQWLTDSETDAHELAAALRTPCGGADSAAAPFVAERGARVVSVRGGDASAASRLAAAWLAAALPASVTSRPLGAIELRPPPAPRNAEPPSIKDGWLRLPSAGVELPVPRGFKASFDQHVRLESANGRASIELELLLGEYFPGAALEILRALSRSMELAIAYSNVLDDGKPYPVPTRLGQAMAQNFEHDGTVVRGRVLAVPLCGGAGLLSVVQYYGDEESAEGLALSQLRALEGSSYCQQLLR